MKRYSGFTLIEIVLVIALGSLILYGVITAAQVANRSSRDAQRRNAVAQVETALESWAASHAGTYIDSSTGSVVTITTLYGGCGSGATQYLDCGVTAPGGTKFTPGTPTSGSSANTLMSITDRTGGTTGTGYCVRVGLESLPTTGKNSYGANDVNKSGRAMTSTGDCSTQ